MLKINGGMDLNEFFETRSFIYYLEKVFYFINLKLYS